MTYFWLIKEAFISIFKHKLRSFFAVIGVAIGIIAVSALISAGNGVKKDVTKSIEGIGTNLIIIVSGKLGGEQSGGMGGNFGNPANFISGDIIKREDVTAIITVPGVKAAAPIALVGGNVRKDNNLSMSSVIGSTEDLGQVFSGFKLKYGRFINPDDGDNKVMVAGESIRKQLFEKKDNIVGEKVDIGNKEFEIIGQLEKPAQAGQLMSSDFDSIGIIPLDTAKGMNDNKDKIFRIGAVADDPNQIKATADEIKKNMLLRHKDDEFSVLTQEDMLDLFSTVINLLTTFITAIAAISLIVGGFGISSVMFMSVADRTREIGVRKAIGATSGLILFQFLIESVILALIGGALGLVGTYGVNHLIEIKTSIHPEMTMGIIYLAIGFCTGVGILFGLIPAARAALKDPVEALREG